MIRNHHLCTQVMKHIYKQECIRLLQFNILWVEANIIYLLLYIFDKFKIVYNISNISNIKNIFNISNISNIYRRVRQQNITIWNSFLCIYDFNSPLLYTNSCYHITINSLCLIPLIRNHHLCTQLMKNIYKQACLRLLQFNIL